MIYAIALLLTLSISVIYTSNPGLAIQQAIFAMLGLTLYFFVSKIDFRIFHTLVKPLYIIVLIFLIIVIILGIETRGSVRWISLGFFNLQPSELAKIAVILALSSFWYKRETTWKNVLLSLLILAPIGGLIFIQPDLGTALTVGFIWLMILIGANVSYFKLLALAGLSAAIMPIAWILLKDYQKNRISSFLSPQHDPLGIGYNVIQSTIAVGSGGLFGRGLGRGTQSRLQFLPEFQTDFIFAFIAEELGFLGSAIVLILYSVIFYSLFRIISSSDNRFTNLIIIGVIAMLLFQIVVNIGMNIGVMPVTGITLPLLSYGGSSILTTLIAFGIANSIRKKVSIRGTIDTTFI